MQMKRIIIFNKTKNRAKREYLENKPKLDAMTMGTENVKKMMENWGH